MIYLHRQDFLAPENLLALYFVFDLDSVYTRKKESGNMEERRRKTREKKWRHLIIDMI